MGNSGFVDSDQATGLVAAALSAVEGMRDGSFWKLLPDDLLQFGRQLETLSRVVYAAQVHLTGEIEEREMASARSCSSTHSLLRQAFNISNAEAVERVKSARQILPREMLNGTDAPPRLPLLAEAVDDGRLGSEHIRTIVETMAKIPAGASPDVRAACESALVSTGIDCDPNFLERAAVLILERADPEGELDKHFCCSQNGIGFRQPQHSHGPDADQRSPRRPCRGGGEKGCRRIGRAGARDGRYQGCPLTGEPSRARVGRSDARISGRRARTDPAWRTTACDDRDELGCDQRCDIGSSIRHRRPSQSGAGQTVSL